MFRNKSEKQKRLSSKEFLNGYEAIWKQGPSVKYQSPDAWNRNICQTINEP